MKRCLLARTNRFIYNFSYFLVNYTQYYEIVLFLMATNSIPYPMLQTLCASFSPL